MSVPELVMNALRAVDHPLVAVQHARVVRVRARVGRRRPARSGRSAPSASPAQPGAAATSRFCSSVPKRYIGIAPSDTPASRVIATDGVDPGQLLQGQAQREVVAAHAAVLLGERQPEQAHLGPSPRRSRTGTPASSSSWPITGATTLVREVLARSCARLLVMIGQRARARNVGHCCSSWGVTTASGWRPARPVAPAADEQARDHAVDRRGQRVLHLHRFDGHHDGVRPSRVDRRRPPRRPPCPASGWCSSASPPARRRGRTAATSCTSSNACTRPSRASQICPLGTAAGAGTRCAPPSSGDRQRRSPSSAAPVVDRLSALVDERPSPALRACRCRQTWSVRSPDMQPERRRRRPPPIRQPTGTSHGSTRTAAGSRLAVHVWPPRRSTRAVHAPASPSRDSRRSSSPVSRLAGAHVGIGQQDAQERRCWW